MIGAAIGIVKEEEMRNAKCEISDCESRTSTNMRISHVEIRISHFFRCTLKQKSVTLGTRTETL